MWPSSMCTIVWTKQSKIEEIDNNNTRKKKKKRMPFCCWWCCCCSFALLSVDGTQANRWHNNVILESCAIHLSFVDGRRDDFSIIYFMLFRFRCLSRLRRDHTHFIIIVAFSSLFFSSVRLAVASHLDYVSEKNAFAVSDSHSLSSRIFRLRFPTIEWSQFANPFSCHKFPHSRTLCTK